MSLQDIETDFPNLKPGEWIKSSEIDDNYNCIAFAAHDAGRNWDPNMVGVAGYYWPSGIPRDWRKTTLIKLFQSLGFQVCINGNLEPEYEKIAIYADGIEATHAARQEASGLWVSKLGPSEDIKHERAEGLNGVVYGEVAIYMRRRRIRGLMYE
jgi:hypothetical protein